MDEPAAARKRLVRSIYAPPKGRESLSFNFLEGCGRVRYFRLGRHALQQALRIANVTPGENVLIPGLICREVADAISSLGALPVYYPVNDRLEPAIPTNDLPHARALIAVNYFGFPQDLAAFEPYISRTQAALIEDNAHGLFSRDADGRVLGTRAELAIFSFRKTLPVYDGAALVINNQSGVAALEEQTAFKGPGEPKLFRMKQMLRTLVPLIGIAPPRYATRLLRVFRPSAARPGSDQKSREASLIERVPSARTLSRLSSANPASEIARRRQLYELIGALLSKSACQPVFPCLPEGVAPYGFPFYMRQADVKAVRRRLATEGFDIFPWPDLPAEIKTTAPPHYTSLWCVQFLW